MDRPPRSVVVTDPLAPEADGATPLHPDDRVGLIPSYIATRSDLNDAEQRNIVAARQRWLRRPPEPEGILDDMALRELHRDMFGEVWVWAGTYRRRETSIGIDPSRIAVSVRDLVQDARPWLASGNDLDETAATFHHRLVAIHPFVNGNGRHARLAADVLLASTGRPEFTWGAAELQSQGDARDRYLDALRAADRGDLRPLLAFVRS